MFGEGHWRWTSTGVLAVAAFATGRVSIQEASLPAVRERSVFRSAVLTSAYLEPEGSENSDALLLRARTAISDHIRERQAADTTLRVSVYARDLDNGPWIGINDRDLYIPSSLTKLVVLTRLLQLEELQPGLLDSEIRFPGSEMMRAEDTMAEAPDSLRLQADQSYSVRELARRMIVYSDNYAYQLVAQAGAGEGISRLLYDLSADQTLEDERLYYDAHTVATVLRALYHRSLISGPRSEFALDLLSKSRYSNGLRRYLPPEALVASKFGFYEDLGPTGYTRQFHECGIVYRPPAPYVVCVLTASDQATPVALQEIVAHVSRILWAR